ncbi:efflux transporter outer membrane subunit [Solimonas soli]|uniref:efflux transporter outer membrane subunit n=1 Tax=Solimonas soli TaxID=413479 RepID=UPI0004B4799E|nr:efflux transporter outer membrane subunit [Solimonas soli]
MHAPFRIALRPLLGTLTLSALAACSFAPQYEVPAVPVGEHYKEAADGDWTPATPADHLPRGRWWTLYGDADLNALVDGLNRNSPNLAAALARYDQAKAYRDQAQAALFPSFSLGGKVERDRSAELQPPSGSLPEHYGNNTLGVSASYELDLWGRVRNAVKAGNANFAAAGADLESARLSLQAQLVDDYLQLRGLDIAGQLLRDTAITYQKALELTQSRQTAGVASGLDVARARTQLQAAKAQVETTAAQRAVLEHAIAVLIGESPSTFTLEPRTDKLDVPSIPTDVPASLLQRRPDVAAAERRTAAANANVGIARAAWFPTFSLGGSVGYASYERTDWFKASNLFWAAGPNLALTLFNGGLREAQIRQARAALDEAGADYRATALAAFAQVEDNLALLARYKTAAEEQALAVESAQKSVDYAMTRYREGATNFLDVTTAQASALATQRDSVTIDTNRLRASVALIRALGGGWSADAGAQPPTTIDPAP